MAIIKCGKCGKMQWGETGKPCNQCGAILGAPEARFAEMFDKQSSVNADDSSKTSYSLKQTSVDLSKGVAESPDLKHKSSSKKEMTIRGAIVTLVEVKKNVRYQCPDSCRETAPICEPKRRFSLNPNKTSICVTEIILEIFNPMTEVWVGAGCRWKLIDNRAYTYANSAPCYVITDRRIVDGSYVDVPPGTKSKVSLWFPQLESNTEISALTVTYGRESSRIDIAPLSPSVTKTIQKIMDETAPEQPRSQDTLWTSIDKLAVDCFARTHNILTQKEIVKLENSISNHQFSIEQSIKSMHKLKTAPYQARLDEIMTTYHQELSRIKKEEKSKVKLDSQIEELYNLPDRQFEEWSADLFEALGFEVELTPKTGDHGIDVLCRKNGKLTVVQCKKYKGVVSAPDIQKFIGAMQNAGADEGYFLTTGTFSIGAEKAAKDAPIVLCDKLGIRELIETALS